MISHLSNLKYQFSSAISIQINNNYPSTSVTCNKLQCSNNDTFIHVLPVNSQIYIKVFSSVLNYSKMKYVRETHAPETVSSQTFKNTLHLPFQLYLKMSHNHMLKNPSSDFLYLSVAVDSTTGFFLILTLPFGLSIFILNSCSFLDDNNSILCIYVV